MAVHSYFACLRLSYLIHTLHLRLSIFVNLRSVYLGSFSVLLYTPNYEIVHMGEKQEIRHEGSELEKRLSCKRLK